MGVILNEVFMYDWNKYLDIVIVIGGVDCIIWMFDICNLIGGLMVVLLGYEFVVRKF